tara:strand:+ start:1350 stop:1781 length:432 start_codon:yes stop_codon:yes gene_type:complete
VSAKLSFDHLGIVCADLAEGRAFLGDTIGISGWTAPTMDPIQKVHVQFAKDACGMIYELIAPSAPESPISQALKSGKNILNHLAYITPDLGAAAAHLEAQGCIAVSVPAPAVAFDGALIQFFYAPLGFLIELIEQETTTLVFS